MSHLTIFQTASWAGRASLLRICTRLPFDANCIITTLLVHSSISGSISPAIARRQEFPSASLTGVLLLHC